MAALVRRAKLHVRCVAGTLPRFAELTRLHTRPGWLGGRVLGDVE
jgi:hypothetical protein